MRSLLALVVLMTSTTLGAEVRFVDVTQDAGIDFVHVNGATGKKYLPETMGSGVAFFDYDGDGDEDLLFVNGKPWPGETAAARATAALYQNDGSGNFTDVTEGSGFDREIYGMGVAVADYDGDGDRDVYMTVLGPNLLFRNDTNGRQQVHGDRDGRGRRPRRFRLERHVARRRGRRRSRSVRVELCSMDDRRRFVLCSRRQEQELLHAGILPGRERGAVRERR